MKKCELLQELPIPDTQAQSEQTHQGNLLDEGLPQTMIC